MDFKRFIPTRLLRRLSLLILIAACLMPSSRSPVAQAIEVIVEDPTIYPAYSPCPESYWYPFTNNRSHTAYLTLNTNNPSHSTNYGEWHPLIPQAGYYQVEAYIAGHDPITWCTGEGRTIAHDTTGASYAIHHAYGVSSRTLSQYPLNNQWLNLGEFYFNPGSSGYVNLSDLNGEAEYSTTVSFSAMRFTFTRLTRPQVYLPMVHVSDPSGRPPPDAGVVQAQGFDACSLPSISKMQTWWNQSPYSIYGLYIGGIHLPSLCTIADKTWVSTVHQQGWSFLPIWVGPQAPCTTYHHKMSADPAVSYLEGRQEASAASSAAASLGLTNYGLGGTIIYFDMEAYSGANLACRQAVAAFMNGWVESLHELGSLAGGYGGACSSYPTDWSVIPHAPDGVWPAYWYRNNYDPNASVFSMPCLSDSLWKNHQRIRQYAGEVNNTWGGVTLNIDINVADGLVAMPPARLLTDPVVTSSPSIEDAGWLSAQQGWSVLEDRLYITSDRGASWVDVSPAPVNLAYFLPGGPAWALSTSNHEGMGLYRSSDWGKTWQSIGLSQPPGDWWPTQLQFTTPTAGWILLKQMTSQAFSSAVLIRTTDGGLNWQSVAVPASGKVSFTSQAEGWLINESENQLYHSSDGGLTWTPAQLSTNPQTLSNFPAGTQRSGWQTGTTGWAATSQGGCTGDKSTPSFTCQVEHALWQTLDGGLHWESIPLPGDNPP